MKWKVPYIDLPLHYSKMRNELSGEFERIMSEGSFILREDVAIFEKKMATFLGVKHVIGTNSGTDSIFLALKAAGISKGDEVITVAHTFVGTISTIVHSNGKPVLVDIQDDFNMDLNHIEKHINSKTKAIIPVHLNGRSCEMDKLVNIAKINNLIIIEDACQSLGGMYKNKKVGSFGLMGCFSLHPMKILNCAGDGGFVSTNDDETSDKLKLLRNHGQETKEDIVLYGYSSRLDNLQAALANVKFKYLNQWIERRREIAQKYNNNLIDLPITLPPKPTDGIYYDVYNSYVIRTKKQKALFNFLRENGIEVFIHINKPISHHKKLGLFGFDLSNNEIICKEIISLPIFPEIKNEQIEFVIEKIKEFFSK